MGTVSAIGWTNSTVNFWWGCTHVGPGCEHCYAEAWDRRTGGAHFGLGVARRKIKGATALMHRLDKGATDWSADYELGLLPPECGSRRRVFVQSMSDLFDREVPLDWFREAWETIEVCDRVDVQIVTKRVSAVEKRLAAIGRTTWPKHVGLIITVCNQAEAARDVPRLLALKAKLGIPWVGLSIEPMLGSIGLTPWLDRIDWVICGGESGPRARPMHPDWTRSLRDQCAAAGVAFFFKQWGEWAPCSSDDVPARFTDHACDDFRCMSNCGYVGALSILLALLHKPRTHPTCFPEGEDGEAICNPAFIRRLGKKAAGRILDGRTHDAFPARAA